MVDDQTLIDTFAKIEQARIDCRLTLSFWNDDACRFWFCPKPLWCLGIGGGVRRPPRCRQCHRAKPMRWITNVGIDHVDGSATPVKNRCRKTGILRDNLTLVYGETDMPSTIRPLIAQHHAHLLQYSKDYGYHHTDGAATWQYSNNAVTLSLPIPNLSLHNTATAITASSQPLTITQDHIQAALPKVKLAGRFDSRRMSARQWVFDVAHNEHGMQFCSKQLTPYVHAYQRQHPTAKLHLVISMLADKDIEPVLAHLQQFSQTVMPIDGVHSGVISHPRASSQALNWAVTTLF